MDYNALWAEIQATPECAPLIVPSFPKVDQALSRQMDQAIADILNADRTKVVSKQVSARTLAAEYPGTPEDAEAVLMKLEAARDSLLLSSDQTKVVKGSMLRRQLGFLAGDGLDFGDPVFRQKLDDFAAEGVLTVAEAEALKSVAEVPDVLTAADISRAVRGPRS